VSTAALGTMTGTMSADTWNTPTSFLSTLVYHAQHLTPQIQDGLASYDQCTLSLASRDDLTHTLWEKLLLGATTPATSPPALAVGAPPTATPTDKEVDATTIESLIARKLPLPDRRRVLGAVIPLLHMPRVQIAATMFLAHNYLTHKERMRLAVLPPPPLLHFPLVLDYCDDQDFQTAMLPTLEGANKLRALSGLPSSRADDAALLHLAHSLPGVLDTVLLERFAKTRSEQFCADLKKTLGRVSSGPYWGYRQPTRRKRADPPERTAAALRLLGTDTDAWITLAALATGPLPPGTPALDVVHAALALTTSK
jgi:hypothetical protein